MVYLTQSDLDKRLKDANCCAAQLAYKTFKEFRLGLKCAERNLDILFNLNALIEIMSCYVPVEYDLTVTTIVNDNCITEEKAQAIFEEISRICKTCFDTINTRY